MKKKEEKTGKRTKKKKSRRKIARRENYCEQTKKPTKECASESERVGACARVCT